MPENNDAALPPVVLNDFSPGIYSEGTGGNVSFVPAPLGAATEANTYRCIARPGGGLGPLPKRTNQYAITHPGVGTTATVVGLQAFQAATASAITSDVCYVMLDVDTNPRRNYLYMFNNSGGGTFAAIGFGDVAYPPVSPTGTTFITLVTQNTDGPTGTASDVVCVNFSSGTQDFARCVMFCTPAGAVIGMSNGCLWVHGLDVTNYRAQLIPQGAGTSVMGRPSMAFWHQTRIVAVGANSAPAYQLTSVYKAFQSFLYYYFPYLATDILGTGVATSGSIILPLDRFQPIGSYGSVSIGELLLISETHHDSMKIDGDLGNPTVTILRGIQPTGRWISQAVPTAVGMLYSTRDTGIWLWEGGNGSKPVSPQLRPDFHHRPTATSFATATSQIVNGESGHPTAWGKYIIFPNNFLFDMDAGGWWMLEDPADKVYAMFSSDNPEYLFGAVDAFTSGTTANTLARWTQRTFATSYSWQSHPVVVEGLVGRAVEIQEVEIVAGVSRASVDQTVTITLTNLDGTTVSKTFTLNSPSALVPVRQRARMLSRGNVVSVRIQADSGSTTPAPVVHSVTLYPHATNPLPTR